MITLAIESSTSEAGIALLDGESVLLAREYSAGRGSDPRPLFDALAEIRKRTQNPERIIAGIGPGSYSGTRIGISVALGLATAWEIPLFGLTAYLGFGIETGHCHIVGDARRGSYYHAEIDGYRCISAPAIKSREELMNQIGSGSRIISPDTIPDLPEAEIRFPRAQFLGIAAFHAKDQLVDGCAGLEPLYLRPPHITQAKSA